MKQDILFLASQSASRRALLESVGISYRLLLHKSDENLPYDGLSFENYVQAISRSKMDSLSFEDLDSYQLDHGYIVTADTLIQTMDDCSILGKPQDIEEAYSMIDHLARTSARVATGCCVRKMVRQGEVWVTIDERSWVNTSIVQFDVPPYWRDRYFQHVPQAQYACGAGIIEQYGQFFLREVRGSYSAVLGLPLYELRQTLESLNFQF